MQKSAQRRAQFQLLPNDCHIRMRFFLFETSLCRYMSYFVDCILLLAHKTVKIAENFHFDNVLTRETNGNEWFLLVAERKIVCLCWMIDFVYTDRCAILMCINEIAATFFTAKIWRLSNLLNMIFVWLGTLTIYMADRLIVDGLQCKCLMMCRWFYCCFTVNVYIGHKYTIDWDEWI